MKESIAKEINMVMVIIYGVMAQNIRENGLITKYMEKENICGVDRMQGSMKEIGKIIKWMVMVSTSGKMVANMKESILMTRNMAKVHMFGLTAGPMWVNGKMANNMVSEYIIRKTDSIKRGIGKMGKGNIGFKIDNFEYVP